MDGTTTSPILIPHSSTEVDAASTESITSSFEFIGEKMSSAVDKEAKERNLHPSIIKQRLLPIDICVFGRAGIGKSHLIKAITHLDIPVSPQIDHVTPGLCGLSTTIGDLTFRFWDTKGIDNWLDIDNVDNMFNDMKELKVQPIFIIYCAAAGGRVDSDIVAGILKRFQSMDLPICYVITNIYAASDEQLQQQKQGAFSIMNNVFEVDPYEINDLHYEYKITTENSNDSAPKKNGILIGVNSCSFTNRMGTMAICNIHELMNFLAGNLNDEDFTKFVALTMKNRDFWDRFSDGFRTRLRRASEKLSSWRIQIKDLFKKLF